MPRRAHPLTTEAVQILAHLLGAAAAYRRSTTLAKWYFYAWILLPFWLPWDALYFHLTIEHDAKFYRQTYSGQARTPAHPTHAALGGAPR
jgi:hypothetical protein